MTTILNKLSLAFVGFVLSFSSGLTHATDGCKLTMEIEKTIGQNYSSYELTDQKCISIGGGEELHVLGVKKGHDGDFPEVDIVLLQLDTHKRIKNYKILEDWLSPDAFSVFVGGVEFGVWKTLKSNGKIFSLLRGHEHNKRYNPAAYNILNFFKISPNSITQISSDLEVSSYYAEFDDKNGLTVNADIKRILLIKNKNNQQFLQVKKSGCKSEDPTYEECSDKKPQWQNEKLVKFNDEFIDFDLGML
jgi:hypothetical protein